MFVHLKQGNGLDYLESFSGGGGGISFLFITVSREALGLTQPPIELVYQCLFPLG